MTNTFDTYAKEYLITFAYYIQIEGDQYSKVRVGNKKKIIINDCFTEDQAERKFWDLYGCDYDGVCLFDTEEVYSTDAEVRRMENNAVIEHLFDTTQFGQTDVAFDQKYSDQE